MKSIARVLKSACFASKLLLCLGGAFISLPSAALNLAQSPLYLTVSQPPLILLTMGRDHKLYYEAYNDYSDLNGDGTIDVGYKPSIDYYGYFDSYKCYDYSSGVFTPVAVTANKKCTGTNDTYWSGDFLNYVTTSRMDAIRGVLYGGKRSTDSSTQTILERAYIPQDAHAWGKEYESLTRDGYLISEYTPLSEPQLGYRHLFASVNLLADTGTPLMRVLTNSSYRIWEWVSIERPVAGTKCQNGGSGPDCAHAAGVSAWAVVPSSATNGLSGMTITTYNTSGAGANPATQGAFDTLEVNYGTGALRCGSAVATTVDGSGNPFVPGAAGCTVNNFMTIFQGTLNIATAGTYTFSVDGDDAVDVFIDGTQVAGWYGGHGECNCDTYTGSRTLAAGTHTIKFRHQDGVGSNSYRLRWQRVEPASVMTDYTVRVEVCKEIAGVDATYNFGREANCQAYGSSTVVYKPTGLLHKYGQNNGMYFGLLTGSYDQNTNGGVLRKALSSITNEIETSTGIYKESGTTCGLAGATACVNGIVGTINRFKITQFGGSHEYASCGWITTRPMTGGECEMWGNPLAEMMYEGLRYFSGQTSPTSTFTTSSTKDDGLGLPKVTTWTNPYASGQMPTCAKPYFMLVSDVYPSFDSDSLPGADSNFSPVSGLTSSFNGNTLNVSTEGGTIWGLEFGSSATKNVFIGQVGATATSAPTVKTASSFGNLRGLAPAEPTRQGTYYAGSVAYFAKIADLNAATGSQKANTYSIALASPLPTIEIPVGTRKVVLAPFAKSVGGSSIDAASTAFQPTNQIVDFYVDTIKNTSAGDADATVNGGRAYYKFRINYEDVEQGADHDMDAIAIYEILLNADNTITVNLNSEYAAGGIIQHMGYVISGTTADGTYLEIRDKDTAAGSDIDYYLDTPNTAAVALPLVSTRTFTASSSSTTGEFLRDPLWYAAKFGGFNDANGNNIPESTEWDADGDGVPDNYFLVVNPLKMALQMDKALAKIRDDSGTSAALSTNSFSFQSDTLLFQSRFNSDGWSGELNAYPVTATGILAPAWQAQARLVSKAAGSRVILTYDLNKTSDRGIPFRWSDMTTSGLLQTSLNKNPDGTADANGENRVLYLRGDVISGLRTRPLIAGTSNTNKLGDIVNSQAQYVGRPNFGYADASYASFSVAQSGRTKVVYVGANDGMVHGFNAATGDEVLAYVPSEMYRTRGTKQPLSKLTRSDYGKSTNPHRFYVDGTPTMGDICTGTCNASGDWKTILVGGLNAGGQGIYALDVTNPGSFTESSSSTIVKWEFLDHDHDGTSSTSTISGDAELGYTYSRPFIVRLCTSRDTAGGTAPFDQPKPCNSSGWYVMFGNGYNNTESDGYAGTGDAVLYVLDANTGYLVKKIAVKEADSVTPNGLSEIAPVDLDGDGTIDYVYAGDLKGNLWRFNFTSDSTSNWEVAFGSASDPDPLYIAFDEQATKVRQPITTAPDVIRHPEGGLLVVFGTGSYLDTNDPSTTQVQTIYGIWDNNATVSSTNRTNLQQQSINTNTVTASSSVTIGGTAVSTDHDYRTVSANTLDWATKKGWYMNLPDSGERVAFNPEIRGGNILKFVTTVPSSDICAAGGYSWEYYISALTGGRLSYSPFMDLQSLQSFGGVSAHASGRKSTVGITPPGTVLTEGQGRGSVFTGGSTGEMDYYKVNLGQATAGRVSWREILGD